MKRLFQKNKTSEPTPEVPAVLPRPAAAPRGRPRIENVAAVIGYSCASEVLDYEYILSLADFVSRSSTAAKDAARALRKELKYGASDTQERAPRLMGILLQNSDTRFKQEIASKRFLAELADLVANKKTQPAVLEMIQRVLSPLAYDYQGDSDLSAITRLYNKIKPLDAPLNGAPLDPEDPLFTPTAPAPRPSRTEIPTDQAQIRSLRLQAEQARGNAGMLSEAIGYAKSEELVGNELIQEFYTKCFNDQELIRQNLAWATAQAEQSRALVESNRVQVVPNPKAFGSNNPFASALDKQNATPEVTSPEPQQTEEEETLAELLLANSEIIEALELHATRFRTANEQVELDQVQERSKQETKFDRVAAGTPDANGAYHDYDAHGREEVEDRERREAEENERAEERDREQQQSYQQQSNHPTHNPPPIASPLPEQRNSMNPYAAYLTTSPPPVTSPPLESPRSNNPYHVAPIPNERSTSDASNYNFDFLDSYTNSSDLQAPLQATSPFRSAPAAPPAGRGGDGLEITIPPVSSLSLADTDEESIKTPLQPSEKALGKMKSSSYGAGDS